MWGLGFGICLQDDERRDGDARMRDWGHDEEAVSNSKARSPDGVLGTLWSPQPVLGFLGSLYAHLSTLVKAWELLEPDTH